MIERVELIRRSESPSWENAREAVLNHLKQSRLVALVSRYCGGKLRAVDVTLDEKVAVISAVDFDEVHVFTSPSMIARSWDS